MLKVHITAHVAGTAVLTEAPGGLGQRAEVPLYRAQIVANTDRHSFGITRCSSKRVFGNEPPSEPYGWNDECPPNIPEKPYYAKSVLHVGTQTFALRLFEMGSPHQNTLQGVGPIKRYNIMIHIGDPACSLGCLTIGGGKPELDRLEAFIMKHRRTEQCPIKVFIDERAER